MKDVTGGETFPQHDNLQKSRRCEAKKNAEALQESCCCET